MTNYPEGAYQKLSEQWTHEDKMDLARARAVEYVLDFIAKETDEFVARLSVDKDKEDSIIINVLAWARLARHSLDGAMVAMPETHRLVYSKFNEMIEARADLTVDEFA